MSILLKVQWVDQAEQPDPCQRIKNIGGSSGALRWKHSQAYAIQSIEHGLFTYYVKKDMHALKLEIGLAANGRKYLKIQEDDDRPRSLLNLPAKLESRSEINLQAYLAPHTHCRSE